MDPGTPVLTEADLCAGFRRLGISEGDAMMAHSSLSAFGWVEGGAEAVITALLRVLGPGGTLAMPTLCQKDKERRFETWDIHNSPSDVGRITETLRLWPGALRSDHATHSVAALGPLAEEITSGHATAYGRPGPWGPAAFGHGSPWDRFYQLNVLYCFLGVSFRVNTMRHYCQSRLVEDALAQARPQARQGLLDRLAGWNKPGVWPHYNGEPMEARLAERGLIAYVEIGRATCRSLRARTMVDNILQVLRARPEEWFDGAFMEWWGEALSVEH